VILGIDASTAWSGLCLYDDASRVVLVERIWRTGTDHVRQILPEADALLRGQGMTARDLTGVGVAVGPGTFNGVRVAVSTAKVMAQALDIPIVGVNTLLAYVVPLRGTGSLVRPILGAARGEIGTGLWRAGVQIEEIEATRLAAPADLSVPSDETVLFVGEFGEALRERIQALGENALLASPVQAVRRPAAIAEVAAERMAIGEIDDRAALAPIYLRPPHITTPRR
jgi:tRNA threonylcarbamoyl adenosine modification protein YeaZ